MPIRALANELQEKAKQELNEFPHRTEDDIQQIRDWLEKQPHLRVRTDDQWLVNFLRCSKFSVQRAKERLDFFYTIRTLTPEFFADRDPFLPEIQDILKRGFAVPLPKLVEAAGPLILILRWKLIQPEKNSILNLVKVILMMADIALNENDNYTVAGVIVLEDFDEYPVNYLLQQTPSVCKKVVLSIQTAYPVRIKQIHCANIPSYFETVFNLFKPFLDEKLKNRIKFYGKNEFHILYKDIPLSVLPKEYGGEGGCLEEIAVEWKKKVESYRDWFLEDAQYCSDEMKRPEKPKTSADVFGVEGSFRKLDVD